VRYADPERIRKAVRSYAHDLRTTHREILSLRWFGSWIKGTASVGSDVDLCVIIDRSDKPRRERIPDFLPRTFPVGIDLFIFTEGEFAKLATEHPSLFQVIENGVQL
jgi:predicted nucleotidyltransferase